MTVVIGFLWKFVVFAFVLGVLIFIHELGHFLLAKWCGVGVVRFSIGFGPVLFRRQWGETQYQICLIPLGGYVRMVGDIPDSLTPAQPSDDLVRGESSQPATEQKTAVEEEGLPMGYGSMLADRKRWFIEKSLSQRSAIVFAGPLFNFLLAIVLMSASVIMYGEPDESSTLGTVREGSPAEQAGLKPGDLILSINNSPISKWRDLANTIRGGSGESMLLAIKRGGETLNVPVTPRVEEVKNALGKTERVPLVGVGPSFRSVPASEALTAGAIWSVNVTVEIYASVWGMLTGKVSTKDLAGPVFIFDKAGEQAEQGLGSLFHFMAMLSISLAALNLLPIPVLDGGHLLFFFMEAVLGPISMRKKEFAQQVGVLLLLLLMCFAIKNDFTRPNLDELPPGVEDGTVKDGTSAAPAVPVSK